MEADGSGTVQLKSDEVIVSGQFQRHAYRLGKTFPAGTTLALTGIVRYQLTGRARNRSDREIVPFGKYHLLVHQPEDIVLVKAIPWWTPTRLGIAIAVILSILVAAIVWTLLLQRTTIGWVWRTSKRGI